MDCIILPFYNFLYNSFCKCLVLPLVYWTSWQWPRWAKTYWKCNKMIGVS